MEPLLVEILVEGITIDTEGFDIFDDSDDTLEDFTLDHRGRME
jgi:hypothetical protein